MSLLPPIHIQLETFLREQGTDQRVTVQMRQIHDTERGTVYVTGLFRGIRQDDGHPLMVFIQTGTIPNAEMILNVTDIETMKPNPL